MKITLVKGSPHRKGSTALLCDSFVQGAREAGHEVFVFDAGEADISPCMACEHCHLARGGKCLIQDDMSALGSEIATSDAIVLSTPLYFFSMSAQLKTVVDRLYAYIASMGDSVKAMALIAAANNSNPHIMDILVANYISIVSFFGLHNAGMVLATGCGNVRQTRASRFPELAYRLGKEIKVS